MNKTTARNVETNVNTTGCKNVILSLHLNTAVIIAISINSEFLTNPVASYSSFTLADARAAGWVMAFVGEFA